MAEEITRDAERIDQLCDRHYGENVDLGSAIGHVLLHNPHLHGYDAEMPAGLKVEMPELEEEKEAEPIRVWS
ncbi:tail protein X [Pseudovibrio ascidiaceicola]|uniref:tail protein X n=1 Tax=Pseudovibrio ascidiaceicola TaxID=285279 RepID=UPI003D35EB35